MKHRKKFVFLFCLVISLFLVTGCWNRRDLNQLVIVAAMGIDKGEDQQVILTAQVIKPVASASSEGSASENTAVEILTAQGKTVFDAVRNFVEESGRKLYYPHTMAIVVGEGLAREGILPVLDFFLRDHELRLTTWFLVSSGSAADVINLKPLLGPIPAQNLEMLLKDSHDVAKSVSTNILDTFNECADESLQPVLSRVEINVINGQKIARLVGSYVFRTDKLVGWLTATQTRGYLFIRGEVKSGIIVVPYPGKPNQRISLEIKNASGKVKPYLEDGTVKYSIDVEVTSNIGEQMGADLLDDPGMLKQLEAEQGAAVKQEIQNVVTRAQTEYKLDILGLGAATARKFPAQWRDLKDTWEEEFPNQAVQVVVKAKVENSGLTNLLKIEK
ncbi:MAG: Ger(x)C family spore germination protein [Peptococcaceae bacterium]|nr:Ger(x)C family spore germination protein [Peptococcaceae bacterium]